MNVKVLFTIAHVITILLGVWVGTSDWYGRAEYIPNLFIFIALPLFLLSQSHFLSGNWLLAMMLGATMGGALSIGAILGGSMEYQPGALVQLALIGAVESVAISFIHPRIQALQTLFSLKGKISRLPFFIIHIVLTSLSTIIISATEGNPFAWALTIIIVVIASFNIVKRLHDLGKPGAYYWLLLIPFFNIYFFLLLLFKKGEQ